MSPLLYSSGPPSHSLGNDAVNGAHPSPHLGNSAIHGAPHPNLGNSVVPSVPPSQLKGMVLSMVPPNLGNGAVHGGLSLPKSINSSKTIPTDMSPGQLDLNSPSLRLSSHVTLGNK